MINFYKLFSTTESFKILSSEKAKGGLSHAYIFVHNDQENLNEYLKIIAKIVMCDSEFVCNSCRNCTLIDNGNHVDVISLPREGESDKVLTEDVNYLINESYLTPTMGNKKLFIINHAETMTVSAQNKLLKTLEEPPKGVYIVLGATTLEGLIPTIRSRAKKLEVFAFSSEDLFSALSTECEDQERLKDAIFNGDKTVSNTLFLYNNANEKGYSEVVREVIMDMKSSKEVVFYTDKVLSVKGDLKNFVGELEVFFRDLLVFLSGEKGQANKSTDLEILKSAQGYNTGSVVYILEKITEAYKRIKFNTNPVMLVDWLLFSILEGKYKWQKL